MQVDCYHRRVRSYYARGDHWYFERLYRQVNRQALAPFFRPMVRRRGNVLDAGAGSGQLARELGLYRAVHLDLSLEQLARLRRLMTGASCLQADLTRLPFRDGVFDEVLCSNVLHYTGVEGLRELLRVTRPGGRLLVAFLEGSMFTRATTRFSIQWGLFPPVMGGARFIDLSELVGTELHVEDSTTILYLPPLFVARRQWPRIGLVAYVLRKPEPKTAYGGTEKREWDEERSETNPLPEL